MFLFHSLSLSLPKYTYGQCCRYSQWEGSFSFFLRFVKDHQHQLIRKCCLRCWKEGMKVVIPLCFYSWIVYIYEFSIHVLPFSFFLLYPSNRVFFQNMCIIKTIDLISFLFQLEHNSSLQNDNHHHHHIPKKVHVYGSDVFNVINVKASKQAANIDEFDSF